MERLHFASCEVGRRSSLGDGVYPYNLEKMSKNSYIHVGVECR